jgi:hypothetical protein
VSLVELAQVLWLLLAALGLALSVSYAGLPVLGQGAFVAVGGFGAALLGPGGADLPLGVACGLAVLTAGLLGHLVALGASRLGGAYLALATWALAWLVHRALLAFPDLSGGAQGLVRASPARLVSPSLGLELVLTPADVSPLLSLQLFVAVLVGGTARWRGPVLGVALLAALPSVADAAAAAGGVAPERTRGALTAALLVAVLALRGPVGRRLGPSLGKRPRRPARPPVAETAVALPSVGEPRWRPVLLRAERLSASYGALRALDDVSLTLRGGQVHALRRAERLREVDPAQAARRRPRTRRRHPRDRRRPGAARVAGRAGSGRGRPHAAAHRRAAAPDAGPAGRRRRAGRQPRPTRRGPRPAHNAHGTVGGGGAGQSRRRRAPAHRAGRRRRPRPGGVRMSQGYGARRG